MTETDYELFMYGIHLDPDATIATISICQPEGEMTGMLAAFLQSEPEIDYSAITREVSG